jgi:uncharacterized protein (DUF2141 family)
VIRAALALAALAVGNAWAGSIVVTATGDIAGGEIGCALFASPAGFPFEFADARQAWTRDATCRFDGVNDGRYAIAVMHDRTGDHKLATNMFGAPDKPWGVSNDARPKFRAPTFDEAAFDVKGDVKMTIRVAD